VAGGDWLLTGQSSLRHVDTIQDLIDHQIVLATDDAGDGSDDEDSD
jgi:hypothetical protein